MCGIAGIFELAGFSKVDEGIIKSMCDVMKYRGPDDSGFLAGDGFGLGSRRLAILDLSNKGHMPMASEDGMTHIVHNGEIYNFQEIRADLEKHGIAFHTNTDTEVALKAFERYGPDCLKMFNGMFAFAIYDQNKKKAFIARDHFGIKPLYYTVHREKLVIASEIKCLWQAGVPKKFNHSRFEEMFCLRYIAGEETVYEGVKRLLPGHYIEVFEGNITIKQWWNLKDYALNKSVHPKGDVLEWFSATFDDSVRLRNISDVPVGVLLSGGLDSSSIAASLARNSKERISTFTIRFKESQFDEGDMAKTVAQKYGLDFNELYVGDSEIFAKTVALLRENDEPIIHGSDMFVNEISTFAKKKVTVLLSGEGGDETLGGYVRYNPLRHIFVLKAGFLLRSVLEVLPFGNNRIKKLVRMLSLKSIDNFIIYNGSDIMPRDLDDLGLKRSRDKKYRDFILQEAKSAYPDEPLRQVMYYDMHIYLCSLLDRNDFMTMRASIECRVPFLDPRIVEGLASLDSKEIFISNDSKSLLRLSVGNRLPAKILKGHKLGFPVPWKKYYREIPEYRQYLSSIKDHKLVKEHFTQQDKVEGAVDMFLAGQDSYYAIVNQLFNICLWYDINFDGFDGMPTVEKKQKTVLYVGSFLLKHGRNPTFSTLLIPHLKERYNIVHTSEKKLKSSRLVNMVFKLINERKRIQSVIIDVYSTDGFWYALIIGYLARFFKIPYINVLRGGDLPRRLKENPKLSKSLFGNSFRNLAPSPYLANIFSQSGFGAQNLPNFIEIERYKFKKRERVSLNLFWLRTFQKMYNPILAIRILKLLVDKGYDARLCMVGPDMDGSLSTVLETAKKHKIDDRLTVKGRLPLAEWSKLSENYDIFINTTNIDNHPVSVLEAKALGMPVVSTNVGGMPYVINDGISGYLNPPNDENAFVESILKLYHNPQKALEMAIAAREEAEQLTWPKLKEKWIEVLDSAH